MADQTPAAVVQEFIYLVNAVYGVYLDTTMAVGNLGRSYMEYHKAHLNKLEETSPPLTQEAMNPRVTFTAGSETSPRPIHETTLIDLIMRNRLSGYNIQFLAQMCVVALYQFWEDYYRPRLAAALGKDTSDIKHDTFGELRHLRRSIIHRAGRAVPEAAAAKALPSFAPDAAIVLDHNAVDQIMLAIKQAALDLVPQGGAV